MLLRAGDLVFAALQMVPGGGAAARSAAGVVAAERQAKGLRNLRDAFCSRFQPGEILPRVQREAAKSKGSRATAKPLCKSTHLEVCNSLKTLAFSARGMEGECNDTPRAKTEV